MLRSVAALLAVDFAAYCVVDAIDDKGMLKRLDIEHADPGRRDRLRVTAHHTVHDTRGRVAGLLTRSGSELLARVRERDRTRSLADLVLYQEEHAESYMAATVSVSGAPMAVLTLVSTRATRRFDRRDLAFLLMVADWTGLGVENALRRELQPRASVAPPAPDMSAGGFASFTAR